MSKLSPCETITERNNLVGHADRKSNQGKIVFEISDDASWDCDEWDVTIHVVDTVDYQCFVIQPCACNSMIDD